MTNQLSTGRLANKGIAITRPVDQAKKLNALILAQAGTPISFSLVEITALENYTVFNQAIEPLAIFDWAIFISSNAVQNAMPRVIKQFNGIPKNLKFAAIGPITALELATFGVNYVLTPQGRFDSESLLALPEMQAVNGQNIMLFRGVGGRELLAETLSARGATIRFAESYQRTNPQANCLPLVQLWRNKQLHAIVVTSSEAMRYLLQMANSEKNSSSQWLKDCVICVNHARVAEPAVALSLQVKIADAPGDTAMLDLLVKTLA